MPRILGVFSKGIQFTLEGGNLRVIGMAINQRSFGEEWFGRA